MLKERSQVTTMTETAGNLVLTAFLGRGKRNVAVVGLALLLSCCGSSNSLDPDTATDRNVFACRQYGFFPGSQQFDECMKYVEDRRSKGTALFPMPAPRQP
jgi:hypothetical protein